MNDEFEYREEIDGTLKNKIQEDFQNLILNYAERNNIKQEIYHHGDIVLREGEKSSDLLILCDGAVNVFAKEPGSGSSMLIASRTAKNIIGEHGFLHKDEARKATVTVATRDAAFIRISEKEMEKIKLDSPKINELMPILKHIDGPRSEEIQSVFREDIHIENEKFSVIIADMHDFTIISSKIMEEHINSFLFAFIEKSDEIVTQKKGRFEDQGDGFKALFRGEKKEVQATFTALEIRNEFHRLLNIWRKRDPMFKNLSLGIGICTSLMSIRRLKDRPRKSGRVLSKSINIASSLSKDKTKGNTSQIYLDTDTYNKVKHYPIKFDKENLLLLSLSEAFNAHRIDSAPSVIAIQEINNTTSNKIFPAYIPSIKKDSTQRTVGRTLFVSYSHNDVEWLARLRIHLKPYVKSGKLTIWDDSNIGAGSDWKNEIKNALNSSKVALLLVSAHYLASDFIVENELTPLLNLAQNGGTNILPIIVEPCDYSTSPLNKFQSLNPETNPLSGMSKFDQEVFFVKASKDIRKAILSDLEEVS